MSKKIDPIVDLTEIIEAMPAVVMRLAHVGDDWLTWFITENVSMYGYTREEFMSGKVKWHDLCHPDDRIIVNRQVKEYETQGVDSFKLHYRLRRNNGDSLPITEFNIVRRNEDGAIYCYDTVIVNASQTEMGQKLINEHARQQLVMNDILMSLYDSDLEHALQIILDRTGVYLDTSRALLFKDSSDHKTCKVVYEWCNRDITSVMDLDYVLAYSTSMPEIYVALQETGYLLVNFGEIPENCKEEFESEGLVPSAIFAIYLDGDHYGFICFDDCVVERKWDEDTFKFLKNISSLISTVLARQKQARELEVSRKATQTVLDNVSSYIFVISPDNDDIVFANRAFKDVFGQDCVGRDAKGYVPFRAGLSVDGEGEEGEDEKGYIESDVFCEATNQWLGIDTEELDWVDGRRVIMVNCSDNTVNKLYADAVEHQAFTDYLTGLPNRYRCDVKLSEAMDAVAGGDIPGCLIYIDLDDFRKINHQYGYELGDELILNISKYLKSVFPEPNEVFRFGGDEFVVLMNHLESRWVEEYLDELLKRSRNPWTVQSKEFVCIPSIGVVKFNGHEASHREILRKVEEAMYEVKRSGGGQYKIMEA